MATEYAPGPPSCCPTCGAELVELERWVMDMADYEAQALKQAGRPLRETERARIIAYGLLGAWRSMHCPAHPDAVGFLAERVREEAIA